MTDNIPISPVTSRARSYRQDASSEKPVEVDLEGRHSSDSLPKIDDSPPDGGYGWVCVVCNAFINGES
jgi:hypothetical protein